MIETALLIFLGALLGSLSSFFCVVFSRDELTGFQVGTYIFGGIFGGVVSAAAMMPVDSITRAMIFLIALSGFFGGSLAAAVVRGA